MTKTTSGDKNRPETAPRACPVCGDNQHLSDLCRVNKFDILVCATCGAEHASPTPSQAELKAYYDRPEWFEGGEHGGYQSYDDQTTWSLPFVTAILNSFEKRADLSVLDVGCGYGTHLALAAERGWKCFGVEVSDHARKTAVERLGGAAYIVESTAELIPHEFDLVLMLDTIEHLPSPYATLYSLFSIGAITPKTRIVISTPNAGATEATQDPAAWAYRHPPSHLVFYKPETLTYLLKRLHFTSIDIQGLAPRSQSQDTSQLAEYGGLLATAHGSNFAEFMRERYVPGTWSKIAEYEHVPRYAIAKALVSGKTVLDFGCGTGYGAALLASNATSVTGLDIDDAAISWATQTHRNTNLNYVRTNDLGASLPAQSFDVITCFEMIEHVDHETQKAVIASFARLLRNDGILLISTPNPATTALYGANPYHLREMNEQELRELLVPHFPTLQILRQHIRNGVTFDQQNINTALLPLFVSEIDNVSTPLAFIGICSRSAAMPQVASQIVIDGDSDFISAFMAQQNALNKARLRGYETLELANSYQRQFNDLMARSEDSFKARDTALHERNLAITAREQAINEREVARHEKNLAVTERDVARHEKNLAVRDADAARHERNVAYIERDQSHAQRDKAIGERDAARNEREHVRMAFHYLSQRRDAEHLSPRFLLRQLFVATRTRTSSLLRRFLVANPSTQDLETAQTQQNLMSRPAAFARSEPPLLCSLVIPTKNGGELFKKVLAALQRQTIWSKVEFIIVDSGSTDETVLLATAAGAACVSIDPKEFNHGATRDYAISLATCERVILSVQDAIPLNAHTLEKLIETLDDETVAGGYARQIPQPDADQLTKRNLNNWMTGRSQREVRALAKPHQFENYSAMEKYLFCNFDNVCSVIRKSVWAQEKFGSINFGEDIDWAERVLKRGHKITYEPAAAVIHSHDRPLSYEFKRTYVCHRKLYAQFGLHQVRSVQHAFSAWLGLTLADLKYLFWSKEALIPKIKLMFKLPLLTALQVRGQYLAARDEIAGRKNTTTGV